MQSLSWEGSNHNFKNHILVTWPGRNLFILRKWCGYAKPNHYYSVYDSLISFSKAKSYSFHFHENYVTWPRSANGLLQLSNGWGNLFPRPATLHLIYKALIQPHLDYCNVVWGNCGVKLAEKLQKLPKSCSASSNFLKLWRRCIAAVPKFQLEKS